jgi:hypothetical protein
MVGLVMGVHVGFDLRLEVLLQLGLAMNEWWVDKLVGGLNGFCCGEKVGMDD